MDVDVLIEERHYWSILEVCLAWNESEYFSSIYYNKVKVFQEIKQPGKEQLYSIKQSECNDLVTGPINHGLRNLAILSTLFMVQSYLLSQLSLHK